jgi:hypothetical protein
LILDWQLPDKQLNSRHLAQRRAVKLLLMPLNMPHPFADLPLHKEQATPATFRGQLIKDVVEKFAVPAGVKVMTLTSLELVPLERVCNTAGFNAGTNPTIGKCSP